MTREDIENIINIVCPDDEDFEKPIISPAYLKKELESLALEQEPSDDMVSRGVFEQIMWERDIAIEQLKELGYGLGEKIRTDDGCISRQSVLDGLARIAKAKSDAQKSLMGSVMFFVEQLPSVTPKQKMGRWTDGFGGCKCSECGCLEAGHSYYCPNCGAKME